MMESEISPSWLTVYRLEPLEDCLAPDYAETAYA